MTAPLFAAVLSLRTRFPQWTEASAEGLLCSGGQLTPEWLIAAYSLGIFPWFGKNTPILWWTPSPRCVLPLTQFHLPKRSLRTLRKAAFSVSVNTSFASVIEACAKREEGTWILQEMQQAYTCLHELGYVHCIEVWQEDALVGGLYGVGLGQMFFGESMFHRVSEASRAALQGLVVLLRARGIGFCDCQQQTPHMMRMGATMISGRAFRGLLNAAGLGSRLKVASLLPWGKDFCTESWPGVCSARVPLEQLL